MAKKLYVVTLHCEAVVFAEDEHEAADYAYEILDTESIGSSITVDVEPMARRPLGWTNSTLVYGDEVDLTLKEAEDRMEEKDAT